MGREGLGGGNESSAEGRTVSAAAKQFRVPRKTLDDRVKSRVEYGSRPGPSTALMAEEESALAAYLLYMAEHVFPLSSNQVPEGYTRAE